MRQPRLTQEAVFEVCNKIISMGEKPSTLKIHKQLGRGSLSTIQKFLDAFFESDAWQEANSEQQLPEELVIPSSVTDLLNDASKTMWTAALHATKDYADQREAEVNALIEVQRQEIEEVINTSDQRLNQIEDLQEEVKGLRAEKDGLIESKGKLEAEVENLKGQLTKAEKKNAELQEQLGDQEKLEKRVSVLEAENQQLTDEKVDLGDQLASEKQAHTKTKSNFDAQVVDLKEANEKARDALEQLNKADQDLSKANIQIASLEAEAKGYVKTEAEQQNQIDWLKSQLESRSNALEAAQGKQEETQGKLDTATSELATATNQLTQANADKERLEQSEANLKAANETLQQSEISLKVTNERLHTNLDKGIAEYLKELALEEDKVE